MKTLKNMVAGLALVSAAYAPGAGAQWTFDTPVPGSNTTSSTMGVSFSEITGGIQLDFWASALTASQRVKDVYFNLPTGFAPTLSNVLVGGLSQADTTVSLYQSSGTSAGTFDIHLSFPVGNGPSHNRFTGGEHVYVNVMGESLTPASFNSWSSVAHNGYFGVASLNPTAVIAAIPEPETYAMLLAGLGLMGWMARRRRLSLQPDPV